MPKKQKEDNPFVELIASAKASWRVRQGVPLPGLKGKDRLELKFGKVHKTFYLDNHIPGLIEETFANKNYETKDGRKPVLVSKRKTPYGWHLVFNLPPGISFQQVKGDENFFADAVKGFVNITWNNAVHMDIQLNTLPTKVPYQWDATPYLDKMKLPLPIGYSPKGLEVLDLTEAPHMLIAGETGFGKSIFLHQLIYSLLPYAWLFIIDRKGVDFVDYEPYACLAEEEDEIYNLLVALNEEHNRRKKLIRAAGVKKIQNYKGDLPYIVVVIDELAEIKNKDTHTLINRILRLSRAFGLHIVAGTQRPSVKVFGEEGGDTRDLYTARLCYYLPSEIGSRMVLGEQCSHAAWLPAIKGRAIYKFGSEIKEVQTMFLDPDSKEAKETLAAFEKRRWQLEVKRQPEVKRLKPR